jgi:hypothetical protein
LILKGALIVLSVNEVIDRLPELDGQPVEVTGLLTFEFENTSLGHFPKAERREITEEVEPPYYQSSVWLSFGSGSVQPNETVLSRCAGKRVLVIGVLRGPSGPFGCGHFSGWGCEIEPYSIERV